MVLFGLVGIAPSEAQIRTLPTAPHSPTSQDCRDLNSAFHEILTELHREYSACMSANPPKFGLVESCDGGQTGSAWQQCDFEADICRIRRERDRENSACRARVRDTSLQIEADDQEWISDANDAYEDSMRAFQRLRDPMGYLQSMLDPLPDVDELVFGPNDESFDPVAAEEIYRFVHNEARAGISVVPSNPVVKAIQRSSLSRLSRLHRRTLQDLDVAVRNLERFSSDQYFRRITSNSQERFDQIRRRAREDP
jgi:hypothetical protein